MVDSKPFDYPAFLVRHGIFFDEGLIQRQTKNAQGTFKYQNAEYKIAAPEFNNTRVVKEFLAKGVIEPEEIIFTQVTMCNERYTIVNWMGAKALTLEWFSGVPRVFSNLEYDRTIHGELAIFRGLLFMCSVPAGVDPIQKIYTMATQVDEQLPSMIEEAAAIFDDNKKQIVNNLMSVFETAARPMLALPSLLRVRMDFKDIPKDELFTRMQVVLTDEEGCVVEMFFKNRTDPVRYDLQCGGID